MLGAEDPVGGAGFISLPGKDCRGHFGDQRRIGVHLGAEFRSEQAFAESGLPVLLLSTLVDRRVMNYVVSQHKHEPRFPGGSGGAEFALAEGLFGPWRGIAVSMTNDAHKGVALGCL